MQTLGTLGYAIAASAFVFLLFLLLLSRRRGRAGNLLIFAVFSTVVWAILLSYNSAYQAPDLRYVLLVDVVRILAWLVFIFELLRLARIVVLTWWHYIAIVFVVYPLLHIAIFSNIHGPLLEHSALDYGVGLGLLCLSFLGLFFLEQLYRNAHSSQRWGLKFLCFGVGFIFSYDLYLYSLVVLYKQIDPIAWFARGTVAAFAAPLLMVAIRRNQDWSLEIFVSRHAVVYTASLLAVGLYLLVVAFGGYYIRDYGGTWGAAAQVIFIFASGLGLLLLLFSGSLRAQLRVFVGKHFYRNKYDYREVWLRFTKALSDPQVDSSFHDRIIIAVSEIIQSSAGALWLSANGEDYRLEGSWNLAVDPNWVIPSESHLVSFCRARSWVIDTLELKENPTMYAGLTLPDWFPRLTQQECLILPLYSSGQLLGLLVLARPLHFSLTWEDTDLLKTVGQQIAGHVAEHRAQQRLAQSSQFEAYNRLASFMMHDLKNLIAQQSLVVNNAAKHKHNPEFIDDMISTVDNSVTRMNHLLNQLRPQQFAENRAAVKVAEVVEDALAKIIEERPVPQLQIEDASMSALVDPSKLDMVVRHVVKNAQDATPDDGSIEVRVFRTSDEKIGISVKDTGKGMDVSFQQQRLFRPFFSTKGSKGMGIGAYQAQEFAREAGGDAHVESVPDVGTTFTITMAAANQ